MSEVKEAAERLVYVLGQSGPLEHIEYVRGALCDNAEMVAKDWLRLSGEVDRLRDLCGEMLAAGSRMRDWRRLISEELTGGQFLILCGERDAWDAVAAKVAGEERSCKK